jgi:hypothetical protein
MHKIITAQAEALRHLARAPPGAADVRAGGVAGRIVAAGGEGKGPKVADGGRAGWRLGGLF